MRRVGRWLVASSVLAAGGGACSLWSNFSGLTGGADDDGGDAANVGDATSASDGAASDSTATDGEGGFAEGGEANPDAGCQTSYAGLVLEAGPLVYLRFGEQSGTVAHDATGHIEGGTYPLTGVGLGAPGALIGDCDTAVELGGSQGIRMPPGLDFEGGAPYSVELWIKRDSIVDGQFVLDHENSPRGGWDLVAAANGAVEFERYMDAGSYVSIGGGAVDAGAWHYVVGAFDGTTLYLYVDGQAVQPVFANNSIPQVLGQWTVGGLNCQPTFCSNDFAGALDELAVYGFALSQTTVAEHYQASGR